MESSILSEVDDTSILRTGSPRRYGCPLNWLPTSRLLPRAAGWSAATLCHAPFRTSVNSAQIERVCGMQTFEQAAGVQGPPAHAETRRDLVGGSVARSERGVDQPANLLAKRHVGLCNPRIDISQHLAGRCCCTPISCDISALFRILLRRRMQRRNGLTRIHGTC